VIFGRRRGQAEYAAAYGAVTVPEPLIEGSHVLGTVEARNTGTTTWYRAPADGHAVDIAVYLDGVLHATGHMLGEAAVPGASATFSYLLQVPEVGAHTLRFDLTAQNLCFFSERGSPPRTLETCVVAAPVPSRGEALLRTATAHNPWFDWPTHGVSRDRRGRPWPLFVKRAVGCRLTDVEGREYVDFVMGFGAALLGYAHPRIQSALRSALDSGATVPLPHEIEMEVTEALCAAVPCAEMVVFGKNGSDVCTAAVRLARAVTGRAHVVFCGYHGWQDWYLQRAGSPFANVTGTSAALAVPFTFNDIASLEAALERHRGAVAAVMLEPAAPVEGPQGPLRDADPPFLRAAQELAARHGAVLVFDEILTGFRYPSGTVQRAHGVVPDLCCLGKALGAGLPLSALVGRAEIFRRGMGAIYYGPTFKSETLSLVSTREALGLYRDIDVPAHVARVGGALRDGVNRICGALGLAAEMIGPPFRMVVSFAGAPGGDAVLMRTLLHQELLRRGVLTYKGFLLPSLAHDDAAIALAVEAYREALEVVGEAIKDGSLARRLEIPPLA
jgi:glutamate-1-semialdehyde aminotransferase